MRNTFWFLFIPIGVLFVGCGEGTKEINTTEDPAKASSALSRHLGITRWCRLLSADHERRYKAAEVVYQLEGQEEVILRLTLGSNVSVGGNLEVIIQEDIDKRVVVSLAFLENGSSISTRSVFVKKFVHSHSSFSSGYQDKEWQEVTLLMAGGKTGSSSLIDNPVNLEKFVLRLVE